MSRKQYQKFSQLDTIDFTGIPYYHCSENMIKFEYKFKIQ